MPSLSFAELAPLVGFAAVVVAVAGLFINARQKRTERRQAIEPALLIEGDVLLWRRVAEGGLAPQMAGAPIRLKDVGEGPAYGVAHAH